MERITKYFQVCTPRARWGALLLVAWSISSFLPADADPVCTNDSYLNSSNSWVYIDAAPCATYGETYSRWTLINGVPTLVKMKYMVNEPPGPASAIVLLFTGGSGDAGITPGTNNTVASAATNFLVRSAQLFANAGFRTVTIDSPEDPNGNKLYINSPPNPNASFDQYRVSVTNAWDIQAVIQQIPGWTNLYIFLAGTSRGSLTAVAQHSLGAGISLSSAVNGPSAGTLYIGDPSVSALLPSSVNVPTEFLVNADDDCPVSTPSVTTNTLWSQFNGDTELFGILNYPPAVVAGTNMAGADPCGATAPHGYLGLENASVANITGWFNQVLFHLKLKNVVALSKFLVLSNNTPVHIDLTALISQPIPPGVPVEFSLPYSGSVQGIRLALDGNVVTYSPNGSGVDDGFLFQFTDTNGVRSVGSVQLIFGASPPLTIRPAATGSVQVSWPDQGTGWFLQETPVISSINWFLAPSGPTNPAIVPTLSNTASYYRLFKP
jgi:hypothetical protein